MGCNNGIGAWNTPDPVESFNPLDYVKDPTQAGPEFMRRLKLQDALTETDAEKMVAPVLDGLFARLAQDVIPFLNEYIRYTGSQRRC